LKNAPSCHRSHAIGTPQECQRFIFTALNGFKLEEVNLRQQEEKSVG
jgi:hypothetical protein